MAHSVQALLGGHDRDGGGKGFALLNKKQNGPLRVRRLCTFCWALPPALTTLLSMLEEKLIILAVP